MQKFIVLYMAPAASLEEWMKQPEELRKVDEERMKLEWDAWVTAHKDMFTGMTAGAGKTKRVTDGSVAEVKNDVMMFSIVEATSHDVVAEVFKQHPHFGIPGAWIDIMPAHELPGMN